MYNFLSARIIARVAGGIDVPRKGGGGGVASGLMCPGRGGGWLRPPKYYSTRPLIPPAKQATGINK